MSTAREVDIGEGRANLVGQGSTFIEFDNVKVPSENLVGKEGQGFEIIMSSTSQLDDDHHRGY